MPKNTPPPNCKTCGKPMKWRLAKTGGRKFRCLDCDGLIASDPSETVALYFSASRRSEFLERLRSHALTAQADLEKLPPGQQRTALIERIREIQRSIDFDLN